ncbi:MAG: dihydrolipoyllysine-residue succinyltransferase [Aaplasma endosymbiont of Hyalomma asiaticum]
MGDTVEIRAENLGGESILEAPVRVLKKVGDKVAAEEVIFVVETDKTSLEIVSPADGIIQELRVSDEETIARGQTLAVIRKRQEHPVKEESKNSERGSDASDLKDKDSDVRGRLVDSLVKEKSISSGALGSLPNVEEFVAEVSSTPSSRALGIYKSASVSDGRHVERGTGAAELVPSRGSVVGERRVKMSKIRQVIAARLKESQNTAAILSTFNEVDMSEVIELRARYKDAFMKRHNVKLGFMSFFIKAVVLALSEIPVLNAEISGDEIIYKDYCNIGVAVGTDKGLVVPVINRAETMSLAEMENTLVELSSRARSGKLTVAEMSGATFTITNGGVYGSLLSTPIINPPQSGILGMHAIQERPVVVSGKIEIRPMMYLALSYDHRIVDGQGAVTFLVMVKQYIEDPSRMSIGV